MKRSEEFFWAIFKTIKFKVCIITINAIILIIQYAKWDGGEDLIYTIGINGLI